MNIVFESCLLSFFKMCPFSAEFHIVAKIGSFNQKISTLIPRYDSIKEILASNSTKSYLRKEPAKTSRLMTWTKVLLNKKKDWKKSCFLTLFWKDTTKYTVNKYK